MGARNSEIELINIGRLFLDSESNFIRDDLMDAAQRAQKRALYDVQSIASRETLDALYERYIASHEASFDHLTTELIAQINRDIGQTVKRHRHAVIRVQVVQDSRGMTLQEARNHVLMDELNSKSQHFYKNRANRRIPSTSHIRQIWRQAMRDNALHAYMNILAFMGHSEAIIHHPHPKHQHNGTRMKIGEPNYGLDDFDRIFHPNSFLFPMSVNRYEELK